MIETFMELKSHRKLRNTHTNSLDGKFLRHEQSCYQKADTNVSRRFDTKIFIRASGNSIGRLVTKKVLKPSLNLSFVTYCMALEKILINHLEPQFPRM